MSWDVGSSSDMGSELRVTQFRSRWRAKPRRSHSQTSTHGGREKNAVLNAWLPSFVTLSIDQDLSQIFADLDLLSRDPPAGSGFTGRRMGKNDLWIAATALHHNLPLLTTDRDFDHLASTIRLEYIDPASGTP